MPYSVPFVRPGVAYARHKDEIDRAIRECLESGDLIARAQLGQFERQFAQFCGTKFCVGVNSGYHALALSLLALGVGPGDEVITVAHTFVATVSAIVHAGATPVLVDVCGDFNMNVEAFERAITKRTKAVIPVHLNGRVCDMDSLERVAQRHGLHIVEDAAQAIGATFRGKRAGGFGVTGCFSFYPFKMLGALGDGGAVTTDDPAIARDVTLRRFNGVDRETGEYQHHGYTALLDNVQAAVLDAKLRHLPGWIEHRRQIATLYNTNLEGIGDLHLPEFDSVERFDVFQNYVIRTKQRDALRAWLTANSIETLVSWNKPMWEHAALALGPYHMPETEAICREVISLPMSAETSAEDVVATSTAIRNFFAR